MELREIIERQYSGKLYYCNDEKILKEQEEKERLYNE